MHISQSAAPPDRIFAMVARLRQITPIAPLLTECEQSMLQLAAQGRSNREIACLMGYAEGTIKQYMHTIFSKLDARDRAHAVAIATAHGYIQLLNPDEEA